MDIEKRQVGDQQYTVNIEAVHMLKAETSDRLHMNDAEKREKTRLHKKKRRPGKIGPRLNFYIPFFTCLRYIQAGRCGVDRGR